MTASSQARPPRNVLVLRPDSQTLAAFFDAGDRISFDGEGRLREGRIGRHLFRRGLEGRVLARRWEAGSGEAPVERRFLPPGEAEAFVARAHLRVREEAEAGRLPVVVPHTGSRELRPVQVDEAAKIVRRIARWDAGRYRADVTRFRGICAPIGILPPDRYRSLVVQATVGCSFNQCRFCTSFRDVAFHARGLTEFREHVRSLRAWLGLGLRLYRSLFLGSANALLLPTERLAAMLEILAEELPEGEGPCPAQGVHSFLDGFSVEPKTTAEFENLRRLGLRTVYLGMETGSDRLRAGLGKPGTTSQYVDLVSSVRAAGLSAAVMVILWAGGEDHAREHEEETARILDRMGLGRHDMVLLSPLFLPEGVAEADLLAGRTPLDEEGRERQLGSLRSAIPPGTRVRRYDVQEFLY